MHVRRLGNLAAYYPRVVWTTARETRQNKYDLVVEHLCKVPYCAAAYSAVPVVAVNHHLFGMSAFLQVAWPIAAGVVSIEGLVPYVYRNLPFAAVSESSKADLVRRGLRPEQIEIIYNGIDFPELEPKPINDRPLRIIYLGRLEAYKRVELLLRAAAALVPRFPTLEVVIVGRGETRAMLERTAAELGIAGRTRFAGFVSDAERDALLADARVFVCPSVKEGWGITVTEANARGVPAVATDAPGLRDAVVAGETGVLVADADSAAFVERLADATGELLADPERAARMSSAARKWARRFDWDSSAQKMAALIERARGAS
jgi:glycosyltransferase involved in cell wall biosynthesis